MKLNRKFSFIILFTIVQSCVLTVFSIINLRSIQNIKDYQNMEIKTEAQLSSIIDYLEKMDYWDFDIENAYSAFESQKVEIAKSFSFLVDDPIVNNFPEDFKANLKQVKLTWQLIEDGLKPIDDILKGMERTKLDANMLKNIKSYGIRETAKLYGENETAQTLLNNTEEAHQQLRKIRLLYVQLMNLNNKSSSMIDSVMQNVESRFMLITVIFAVITTVILSVLILIVTTKVSKRIISVQNMTTTLAEKDFTVSIEPEGSDEVQLLMANINNMVNQVNDFFRLVKSTAKKALNAEFSINESAGSTANATALIDQNIDEINKKFSDAVAVINSTIGVIAEMNLHVETLVQNNNSQTEAIANSSTAINEVVNTLEYISKMAEERVRNASEMHTYVEDGDEKISSTNEILSQVAQQLDEVYEVVTIINNVAEQTNLLSMNAAIESAHAGEAGKGFGVVAEEIRSLAEETSENADKISKVVNTIVDAVEKANKSSQSAFEAFEQVSSHADQIVGSLKEITGGIGKIDNQMQQIKQRSEETSTAADAMNRYCVDLANKQKQVSFKVDNMNDVFFTAISSLHKIKDETADIVHKMKKVSSSSDQSFKNLTELEMVLDEFKTSKIEEENQADATAANTDVSLPDGDVSEVLFDPDEIEEIEEEVPVKEKEEWHRPTLAEIDAKLNEMALSGDFGISDSDTAQVETVEIEEISDEEENA